MQLPSPEACKAYLHASPTELTSGSRPATLPMGTAYSAQQPMTMPTNISYAGQPPTAKSLPAGPAYGGQPAWAAVASRPGSVVPPTAVASNAFPLTVMPTTTANAAPPAAAYGVQPACTTAASSTVPTTMAYASQPAAGYSSQPPWAALLAVQPATTAQPAVYSEPAPATTAAAYRSYVPQGEDAEVRTVVPQRAPPVQPVFTAPMMPMPPPMPMMPRDVIVDRPFPVFPEYPVPVMCPGSVTHTWHNFHGQMEVNDFPYHDPAYGMGWRHHYPDDVDDNWMGGGMYSKTPFQQLLDRREEETWQDLWEDAHMGVSEHGWRHRPLPFSRRVRDPEGLIPKQRDFYTELLL